MNSRLCFKPAHLSAAPFAQSCPLAVPQGPSASIPLSAWRHWPDRFFEGLCFSPMLERWTPRHRLQSTTGAGKGGSFNLEEPRTSSVDWSSSQNLQVCKETPLFPCVWGSFLACFINALEFCSLLAWSCSKMWALLASLFSAWELFTRLKFMLKALNLLLSPLQEA